MNAPKCKVFEPSTRYSRTAMRSLHYDGDSLVIDLQGDGFSLVRITFSQVVGFRALDERDLCELWPTYSESAGWLFEVEAGGWLELESHRKLFNSPAVIPGLREFLLTDESKCVSVFSIQPPEIRDLGTVPPNA